MTDYINDLRDALQDAAAREYGAGQAPAPSRARTRALRRVLTRRKAAAIAGISLLASAVAATVVLLAGATTTTHAGTSRPGSAKVPAQATTASSGTHDTASMSVGYSLVKHPSGSVTVTVHNLRAALGPLNARLAALGINERIVPITSTCPPSNWAFVYPVKHSQFPQLRWTFTQRNAHMLGSGYNGYIGIGRSHSGQLLLAQGATQSPLPPCFNSALGKAWPVKK